MIFFVGNFMRVTFMRILFTALLLVFAGLLAFGQEDIFTISNGSISTCDGYFSDNNTGTEENYGPGDYVFTICPETPGQVISVEFVGFDIYQSVNPANSDYLNIYDDDQVSQFSIGSFTGNQLLGLEVIASVNNPTGCLTFVFSPDTPDLNAGWGAIVTCTDPCAIPIAESEISDPLPQGVTQTVSVCLDQPVTFNGEASEAGPGFQLDQYTWNFADGTLDSLSGAEVTHAFTEPGEYLVTLSVRDENGCESINPDSLQVLVSTIPEFNVDFDQTICLGAEANLDGNPVQSITWTALPPQVNADPAFLDDGFGYIEPLEFDIFEEGAELENCDDFVQFFANMEHSFLGDLELAVECPNGTYVELINYFLNTGGGTMLGEALDEGQGGDELTPGVGYDYVWQNDSPNGAIYDANNADQLTYVNTAGQEVTNNVVFEGAYAPDGDFCDFVGCPLNGTWLFYIYDNLASDNGNIFEWGIQFNPELYPGVTTFTPVIGEGPDSSFWSGPFVSNTSANGNFINAQPDSPGEYSYEFTAINNFGCAFDTTVTVTVTELPPIFTEDLSLCEDETGNLFAALDPENPILCGDDAGDFEYCYGNDDNTTFTYCPDNLGDGITFMTISFEQGNVEPGFDVLTIYDGDNTGAPVLAQLDGDLAGQTFTATNANGCLTMNITSDGSVSCGSGSYDQFIYSVGCDSGLENFELEWSPATYLDDPSSSSPEISGAPGGQYEYEVSIYPPAFPECAVSDTAFVNIQGENDAGLNTEVTLCQEDVQLNLLDALDGDPQAGGQWFDPNEQEIDEEISLLDAQEGEYTYYLENFGCPDSTTLTLGFIPQANVGVDTEISLCEQDADFNLFDALEGNPDPAGIWLDPNEQEIDEVINLEESGGGVYLYILENIGCPDSSALTLNFASQNILALNDTTVCINGTASFQAEISGDGSENAEFYWFGTGSDATGETYNFEPSINPSVVNVYAIYGGGCYTDTTQAIISQYEPLSMTITNPETVCQGDLIDLEVFEPSGGFGEYSVDWTGDDGSIYNGNPVQAEINQETEFCVVLSDECETTPIEDCVVIGLEPLINANFLADTLAGCNPIFVRFAGFAEDESIISSVVWNFGDGSLSNDVNFTTHSYEDPGEYDVSLTITSTQGCVYDSIRPDYIYSYPNPDAEFSVSPQVALLPESEFDFINNSFGGLFYDWTFGSFGTSEEFSPSFDFVVEEAQVIPVQLIANNQFGCADTIVKNVVIEEEFLMYVPNAFTPDGDGVNDFFFVQGQDINRDEYLIQIFNRWGEMIWESRSPDQPWDGSHLDGGYFVKEGVFVWRIETRSLTTAEKKEFTGHVTLIR